MGVDINYLFSVNIWVILISDNDVGSGRERSEKESRESKRWLAGPPRERASRRRLV